MAIDLVPLLDRLVRQLGRGRAEVDVHDLAELLPPIFGERLLRIEAGGGDVCACAAVSVAPASALALLATPAVVTIKSRRLI